MAEVRLRRTDEDRLKIIRDCLLVDPTRTKGYFIKSHGMQSKWLQELEANKVVVFGKNDKARNPFNNFVINRNKPTPHEFKGA